MEQGLVTLLDAQVFFSSMFHDKDWSRVVFNQHMSLKSKRCVE